MNCDHGINTQNGECPACSAQPGEKASVQRVARPQVRFFGRDFTTRSCPEWSGRRSGRRFKRHANGQTFLGTAKNKSAHNRKK